MRSPRRFSLPTGAVRAVVIVAVVVGTVATVTLRAHADPSFGLLAGSPSLTDGRDPGDLLEPTIGAPAGAPGGTAPQGSPAVVLSDVAGVGVIPDAISFGDDNPTAGSTFVTFSVDGTSTGYPLATFDVASEALGTDGSAAADVFSNAVAIPALGTAAPCGAKANRLLIDGDGLLGGTGGAPRTEAPGLGLDESPPGPPGSPGRDDIALLEMSDSAVVDADGNGVADNGKNFFYSEPSSALIFVKAGDGTATVYATATEFGLQSGDDIDALAVYHTPGNQTFSGSLSDVVVFSLAPGSPSLSGSNPLPRTCDLPSPATGADLWSKRPGQPVTAYLSAEQLGLCASRSYGLCNPYSASGNDNIDAVDIVTAAGADLDGDGIDDAVDPDDNGNGHADQGDPCPTDPDGDCLSGAQDNCPTVYDPLQTNSDSGPLPPNGFLGDVGGWRWQNAPSILNDATVANGDRIGDPCDPDTDNDGRLDAEELAGTGCPSASGDGTTEVSASKGYAPSALNNNSRGPGIDSAGHPSWDTDGDSVLDGVECAAGTDPKVAGGTNGSADRTECNAFAGGVVADDDSDGVANNIEVCKWGSSKSLTNTDGDALGDCKEVMDVNGNGVLNASDFTVVRQAVFGIIVGDLAAMDISGNGTVSASDATLIQQKVFLVSPCL